MQIDEQRVSNTEPTYCQCKLFTNVFLNTEYQHILFTHVSPQTNKHIYSQHKDHFKTQMCTNALLSQNQQ